MSSSEPTSENTEPYVEDFVDEKGKLDINKMFTKEEQKQIRKEVKFDSGILAAFIVAASLATTIILSFLVVTQNQQKEIGNLLLK